MSYDYDRGATPRLARAIRVDKAAIRQLARDVEALVARKLEHETGLIGRVVFGQLPFEIRAVDGSHRNIWIRVQSVPSSDFRYFVSGGYGKLRSGEPVVLLNVNANLEAETVWKATNAKTTESFIYPLLLHEITHAADIHGPGLGMSEAEAHDNDAAYYNNPSEVRAYLQEVVDEVEQRARLFPKLKARFGERAIGMLLNMSTTWTNASPHWTAANRQKVLKAVYQALESSGVL